MHAYKIIHSCEPLQPARYSEANALIHSRLGTDCSLPIELPSPSILALGYFLNDELVGVATAEVRRDGSGYLGNCVVAERYSGNGIGTQLVKRRVEWLRELGVPYIVADAWASRFGVNAAKPLVRNGFHLVGIKKGHFAWCKACPACVGLHHCVCDAWEYRLILRDFS